MCARSWVSFVSARTRPTPSIPRLPSLQSRRRGRPGRAGTLEGVGDVADRFLTAAVEHDGRRDAVAVEEPLEIRVDGEPLAVTMRTPGHDEELALGFLFGEGLIGPDLRMAGPSPDLANNVVDVAGPLRHDPGRRRFYTTSSCGVCGKGALEKAAVAGAPVIVGVGAPTSLAVALAADRGMTLAGFARDRRVNVYTGTERIAD